jgi:hypothetical protein
VAERSGDTPHETQETTATVPSSEEASLSENVSAVPTSEETEAQDPISSETKNAEPDSTNGEDAEDTTGNAAPQTKPCPYCNATLRADVITCRFCGRDLVAQHATRLVLSNDTWNTDIPQWLIEAEQKAYRRRQLWLKFQRLQWPIVCGIIGIATILIFWRVINPPPDPNQQVRVLPRFPLREGSTPTPQPTSQPTPTPTPDNSAVAGFEATKPTPTPAATPRPESSATPEPTPTPLFSSSPIKVDRGPAIVTTAQEIAAEFQDYRSIADDKYNGQDVRVTGSIRSIDTTSNSPFILLSTTGNRPPVKCLLKATEKDKLARLRPGKLGQFRGVCEGAFLEVILSDCVIEF